MPKRSPQHMSAQRERILRATIRCLGDYGPEHTSIIAIGKAAELSTGAIYKHFGSKDEIIAAALHFASMDQAAIPTEWPLLRDELAAVEDEQGFDVVSVARTSLQLLASSLRPGPLQAQVKPNTEKTLSVLAERLADMETAGQIRLKMDPMRTAICITALAEGLTWIGLASDRRREEISADIKAGLACLVDSKP